MTIQQLTDDHIDGLTVLFDGLSAGDVTLIRESVHDRAATERLAADPEQRWVATDEVTGEVVGYATVNRLPGWSDHVGELRIVVDSTRRGGGVGRALTQQALRGAFGADMRKVVIELVAGDDRVIDMFAALGFTGEALLRNHIRDHDGNLRDVIVLAHHADEGREVLETIGVADALM